MSFGGRLLAKCSIPTETVPPWVALPLELSLISTQTGHCKCQQVLISLSSNKTANAVELLTWRQLYWYCSAYLVCLRHLPLELSHGVLIRAVLCARIAVTHGFVPGAEEAAWAVGTWFLEPGSATPGEGLLWAGVSNAAAGAVGGAPWLLLCFLPSAPLMLWGC